jgi:hypothetical protein
MEVWKRREGELAMTMLSYLFAPPSQDTKNEYMNTRRTLSEIV